MTVRATKNVCICKQSNINGSDWSAYAVATIPPHFCNTLLWTTGYKTRFRCHNNIFFERLYSRTHSIVLLNALQQLLRNIGCIPEP